jgi:large subunit ribosomal protein L21
VTGAAVKATVVEEYRDKKVLIWKYHPGLRYRRRRGHRQYYTRLKIDGIEGV